MTAFVKVQLNLPKDFVHHLDHVVKAATNGPKSMSIQEWLNKTEAGIEFYRDLVFFHKYDHLSNKEIAKATKAAMAKDLGIEPLTGRPSVMQHRITLLMEAFYKEHPLPPPQEVKPPKQAFVKGKGWVHNEVKG
jgi:hypothetical protein